jgi:hypothetical protein
MRFDRRKPGSDGPLNVTQRDPTGARKRITSVVPENDSSSLLLLSEVSYLLVSEPGFRHGTHSNSGLLLAGYLHGLLLKS